MLSVFIKQVVEGQGKDGHVPSSERKRKRLTTQDQLLMQLRETKLHKRVGKWMDSMNSDSGFVTSFGNQHALLEIAECGFGWGQAFNIEPWFFWSITLYRFSGFFKRQL
ncbi:unnamed protein product [Camellia sinensis]